MEKRMLQRVLTLLICVVLMAGLLMPGYAAEEPDFEGALQAIARGYEEQAETVDLTEYNIPKDALWERYKQQLDSGVYPWYAQNYTYSYNVKTERITEFVYKNLDPAQYDYALYERRVAEILAATVFDGMSQWQIALSIHDYLVAYGAYDESYTYYEGYDMIVRSTSVCNGYAEAYMDLMNRVGIPCVKVASETMNHAWNLVCIGGKWYHVDVTWDDPTSNQEGRVRHKYFLISDGVISDEEHEHLGWETDIVCDDTSLDTGRFWHEVDSQIIYESADLCYFRKKTGKTTYAIYSRTGDGTQKKLASWDAGYIDIGGGQEYFYGNNGLSLYEGRLYYSTMTKVYSIKTNGNSKKTVYTHATSANKQYIAGSYVADGILYLTLADHDGNPTSMQMDLGIDGHSHAYTADVTAATCTQKGKTSYQCTCGIAYEADHTPATGHSFGEGVVVYDATIHSSGLKRYTCISCGEVKTEEIPQLIPTETTGPQTNDTDDPNENPDTNEKDDMETKIMVGIAIVAVLLLLRKKKK